MTRIPFFALALASVSLVPLAASAADRPIEIQDEIIVTASRVPQNRLAVGSAVDSLSETDIKTRQDAFLSDLLRDLPGLAVNRSGPAGAFTQVRLRGGEASHTLVIIDGIEVGDPFNAGEFEFAHLTSGGVSRVEVLRGPQSALWGSEAIGGVINVVTGPSVTPEGPWAQGFAEGGSFGTLRGSAEAGTAGDWGVVRGSLAYSDISGISASPSDPEKDGYDNLTGFVFTTFNINDAFSLSLSGRHVSATAAEDAQDFTFGSPTQGFVIDSDGERKSDRWYGRAVADLSMMNGQWTHQLSANLTDTQNESFSGGAFSFGSEGRKWDFEYQTNFAFETGESASHALSAVLEYEDLSYENRGAGGGAENQSQTGEQKSAALEYRLGLADQVFLSGALRYDDNDRFDDETTYRVTAAWAVPDTGFKLRGSYGTGVAQPSFFELFGFNPDFFIGNPNLQPESSEGWDVGVDYSFADGRGLASLTYFDSNLENEIFTDFGVFPFTVDNRSGVSTRDGIEAAFRVDPLDAVSLSASYTYTDAKDDGGARELRRPRHTGSLNVTYRFAGNRAAVDFGLNYNGEMQDSEFIFATPETSVTLDDYVLGTLAASFDVTDRVQLIGRVENLFDESYQEVFGFASPGIGAYAGVRIRLGQK
ncbi:MAG: TonB-dependent receptor [Rhodospirillaceae bacterium]|jgi:vitamin B12 transporter|nr:TonB-dependent receptor [Rhodospirillaceae bacterium]MBT5565767.1 TonB-dependent receptor [Rhodospirillaceae bacterium]MBT6088506.1 TonB-dependent receptor [Rhodospirillaceae bacterium]